MSYLVSAALWLFVLSSVTLALDRNRSLDQFSYQTWQTGSGLPQNTIHSILQTKDGYLWLATEGGLVRFDGYAFTTFDSRNTPELRSDFVQSLAEDRTGALWIGTAAALCRYSAGRFESISLDQPPGTALVLHNDRTGGVWAVTPDVLIHWSGDPLAAGSRQITAVPRDFARLTGTLAEATDGTVWLGTRAGVDVLEGGKFKEAFRQLPSEPVNALLLDKSAHLWIAASRGLYTSAAPKLGELQTVRAGNAESPILVLFEDWEHNIWIGGENGLERLTTPERSTGETDRTLSGTSVIAVTEDAEGDLWLGTESAGVTVIRNQKFVVYGTHEGLASDSVRCLFENQPGIVSIGTDGGLTQLQGGRFHQLSTANGLSSNVILSLGRGDDGNLTVGTPDGLDVLRGGRKISTITSSDGLPDDFVRSTYRDSDGSLWVGTRRGLSHKKPDGAFLTYTQADGLGSDLVGSILRDARGSLWVGTFNGLSKLEGEKFRTFSQRDGLSSNVITTLHEDNAGGLWIGTADAGLDLWANGGVHPLPKSIGLPDAVLGIGEDDNGEFWLASKTGIARVSKNELRDVALGRSRQATVAWYGTSDGLRISECSAGGHPAVVKQRDGTLWFATRKGAAALYPEAARLNRVAPPVVIESVRVDDKALAVAGTTDVPAGYTRLAFQYAGISLAAPQKVIYRYQLEGFDKDWIEAGSQRVAYYTNLAPAEYRFRVLARNNDGFWNDTGALVTLRLEPRFYQTIWFYILLAMAAAAAIYGVYRWRVAEVEARFHAVLQERNRIAREIHDTLAQGFVGVSVQLEIVSRLLSSSAETAREHLDRARLQVRSAIAEARRSIWQLRSEGVENEDLASRLSQSVRQTVGSSPVKVTVEVRGTYRPLRPQVEDELLRIGQEAVNNAVRHGKPQQVAVELDYLARTLCMTITDDGCGFEPQTRASEQNGHYGLQGMRERAQQIKANLLVESSPGRGTKVSVEALLNS